MSPAETLRAAADLLDAWADELPQAPWGVEQDLTLPMPFAVYGGGKPGIAESGDLVGEFDREDVSRWVAAWSPGFVRLLAEFLRDLAQDAVEMAADMRAVALAEVILVALEK